MTNNGAFRREIVEIDAQILAKAISWVFNTQIDVQDIQKTAELIRTIEKKMDGRIAGDIEDYVLNFYIHKFSAKNHSSMSDQCHLEIGVLFGGSLIIAALALQEENSNHRLIGVDPLDGYYRRDPIRGNVLDIQTGLAVTKGTLVNNLEKFGFDENRVEIWQQYSTDDEIKIKIQDLKISTLFIDGDHSYDGIKNDWIHFSNRVVHGGYILIDNYNDHSWPEVAEFLHTEVLPFNQEWEVQMILNRSVLLKKTTPANATNLIAHSCYKRRKEATDILKHQISVINGKNEDLVAKNEDLVAKNEDLEANLYNLRNHFLIKRYIWITRKLKKIKNNLL